MCGIAGLHRWDGPAPLEDFTGAMTSRLARRGPDGEGLHSEPGIALGHRRLAVIDLSERGKQPMPNEDGTVWLACNGEIYNYRELRRGLQDHHAFRSDSDCEVLIHLYEDSAEDLPSFLEPPVGDPRDRALLDWLAQETATQSALDRLLPDERTNAFDGSALNALKARMRDSSCATNPFTILVFALWAEQRELRAA